jgi:hypothetical protein
VSVLADQADQRGAQLLVVRHPAVESVEAGHGLGAEQVGGELEFHATDLAQRTRVSLGSV